MSDGFKSSFVVANDLLGICRGRKASAELEEKEEKGKEKFRLHF
jgi:hypothetical protein